MKLKIIKKTNKAKTKKNTKTQRQNAETDKI